MRRSRELKVVEDGVEEELEFFNRNRLRLHGTQGGEGGALAPMEEEKKVLKRRKSVGLTVGKSSLPDENEAEDVDPYANKFIRVGERYQCSSVLLLNDSWRKKRQKYLQKIRREDGGANGDSSRAGVGCISNDGSNGKCNDSCNDVDNDIDNHNHNINKNGSSSVRRGGSNNNNNNNSNSNNNNGATMIWVGEDACFQSLGVKPDELRGIANKHGLQIDETLEELLKGGIDGIKKSVIKRNVGDVIFSEDVRKAVRGLQMGGGKRWEGQGWRAKKAKENLTAWEKHGIEAFEQRTGPESKSERTVPTTMSSDDDVIVEKPSAPEHSPVY